MRILALVIAVGAVQAQAAPAYLRYGSELRLPSSGAFHVPAIGPTTTAIVVDGTVTGRVTDARTGAPLASATVLLQGTQIGAVTGNDGTYRLARVPAGARTITARRIGYTPATQTVTVPDNGVATANFELQASATNLGDVVVTGTAGNQTRAAQSAVVSTIDAADVVAKAPISNVSQLLEGRVSGVVVTPASGTTGASSRINIRGASSISLSNDPLVFIDGIRMVSGQRGVPGVSGGNIGGQSLSALNDLNPDDIEIIEIVKGPAAATLYGADASAGVIQIITKKGRVGAKRLSQNLTAEYNRINPNFTPRPNYGTCTASNVAAGSTSALCSGKTAGAIVSDNPLVREGAFKNGTLQSLRYNVQGGGDAFGVFLSATVDNEIGTTANTYLTRRDGRANVTWLATPRVSLDVNVGVSRNDYKLPNGDQSIGGYMIVSALTGAPTAVTRDANGNLTGGWSVSVPVLANILAEQVTQRATPSLQLRYSPASWFTNRLTTGADLSNNEGTGFYPKSGNAFLAPFSAGYVINTREQLSLYTLDYLGNIKTSFLGREGITSDFSFGSQYINNSTRVLQGTGTGGLLTSATNLVSSSPTTVAAQGYSQQKSLGYFVQEQLGFADRLFLQAATRVDWNSAFGTSATSAVLPKFGVSYVVSKERFWESLASTIPTFRLRAAYGTTGRSPAPGASLRTYNQFSYVTSAGALVPGVAPANPGNQNLKPERGTEFEAGFDAGFFGDRAGLELTYFNKKTSDLLLVVPLAPSAGFSQNPYQNIGEVLNRGLEFTARVTPVSRTNFSWDANFNGGTLHNELLSLGTLQPLVVSSNGVDRRFIVGRPLSSLYTRRIKQVNVNGSTTVSDTAEYAGSQIPSFTGNLSTTMTFFQNLRVYASFTGKRGAKIWNFGQLFSDQFLGTGRRQIPVGQPNAYSAEDYARLFGPFVSATTGATVAASQVRDAYLQSNNFVRFQELSATFNLPTRFAQSFRVTGASFTVGGRNLHVWKAKDFTGFDPEVITSVGNADANYTQFATSDLFTTPPSRRWIARLNLQF